MKTLTKKEWDLLFSLPSDGKTYHVEGVAFRAVHLPQTRTRNECVIAETRYGTIRRRCIKGKWSRTDYINHSF